MAHNILSMNRVPILTETEYLESVGAEEGEPVWVQFYEYGWYALLGADAHGPFIYFMDHQCMMQRLTISFCIENGYRLYGVRYPQGGET